MRILVVNLNKRKRRSVYTTAVWLIMVLFFAMVLNFLSDVYVDKAFLNTSAVTKKRIIILDAGHGGEDSGAVGVTGVLEKDLNLDIAMEIGSQLTEKGYTVIYTRTEDKLLYLPEENIRGIRKISDLKNRCKIAVQYPDSIFISIHMNSYGESKYSGLQVYYSEIDDSSRTLADLVQSNVRERIQNENKRKIKEGRGIYLLENISSPSVLIECGFLTNREECKKLSEKEYQKQLSFSIVCGIIEYIERIPE